jgi:hypothetical protein
MWLLLQDMRHWAEALLAKPEANLKTIQVLTEVLLSMPELLHEKIYIKIYI